MATGLVRRHKRDPSPEMAFENLYGANIRVSVVKGRQIQCEIVIDKLSQIRVTGTVRSMGSITIAPHFLSKTC